jgi:hypothetical protein
VDNRLTRHRYLIAPILLACLFTLAGTVKAQADETPSMSTAAAEAIIKNRARQVILALKAKNTTRLATYVHPTKGLRFSPYTYVEPANNRVFTRAQVAGLAGSSRRYLWGEADGSGDPIRMTYSRYHRSFV